MSDTTIQKACILYLRDASLNDLRQFPEVVSLVEQGAAVELEAAPITSPQSQHYQVFSGRLPATFGFFDTLMPLSHLPRTQQGANGYSIVEDLVGRDVPPRMLPDILRTVGWQVQYEETAIDTLALRVHTLTATQTAQPACVIVQSQVSGAQMTQSDGDAVSEALRTARTWAGEDGLVAIISDGAAAPVQHFVNVNNFLVDMELIERDENGAIDWENSVAYYAGHGQLWINLMGREPEGAVHPQDEYEEFCETLIKALPGKLKDSAGNTVIERIYRKSEIYIGDYLFSAPDLVIVFKPGYAPSPSSTHLGFDDATVTAAPAGTTSRAGVQPASTRGVLLASAPVFNKGVSVTEAAPMSGAVPSLLHALGIAYNDADSTAIAALFSESFLQTNPVRNVVRSNELSEEDEELVIERLRDLGYV